jgi:maleylacetoacetate isomerase
MKLYEYWRSSASFRVRIGLNLKQQSYESVPIDLRLNEQSGEFTDINIAGLVPALRVGDDIMSQSVAILNYLDRTVPEPPLYPADPIERAQVEALVLDIACDIHPLNNLRVLGYLKTEFAADPETVNRWYHHWLEIGFDSLEHRAMAFKGGDWFYHDTLSMADVMLVPQVLNALRFEFDMTPYPQLMHIYEQAITHPAFADAMPRNA